MQVMMRFAQGCLVVLMLLGAAEAQAQFTLGLGGEFFFDDGELDDLERISVQRDAREVPYASDPFVSGSIWGLAQLNESMRFGGSFTYYGSYGYISEEEQREEEPDVFTMGPLMEITGRFEWLHPLAYDFDLILSAHAGLALLVPDGDFEAEITALEDQNISVAPASVPRLGYVVGPLVGSRWRVHEMLSVRSDVAFYWEQIFLFQTETNVGGIPYLKESRLDILRFKVGLSLELVL